jgi:1,4-dihydroxy-6-naphthoate synthase
MTTLSLGYSPCPNDTFIFYGLARGAVPAAGLSLPHRLEDVETLNALAARAELDVTKLSLAAYAHVAEEYCLLRAGAALGKGCGPLVVAREARGLDSLAGARVALPGRLTTAALLFALYAPQHGPRVQPLFMPFDRIMPAVAAGEAEAGVIIHEGRFTYAACGLAEVADLGRLWEADTGLPLPLGAIAARRSLGVDRLRAVEAAIRASLAHARAHEAAALAHAKRSAQEMAEGVLRAHINLYVNDFSVDIGPEGERATLTLLTKGAEAGALPPLSRPAFLT